ncbi:MAG: hypothetical protein M3Q39_06340 [Actinomycetota bacterium]|nr:hypothetical protein [Actinomycetota bacterium]
MNTIVRWECPECGKAWRPGTTRHNDCPGVPVERTYVAVDALRREAEALPYRQDPDKFAEFWDDMQAAINAVTEETT